MDRATQPWAELVFHVLAHASGTGALPSSLFDSVYVQEAARRLGPASERTLGEDASMIERLAPSHDAFARLQLVAWLFRDVGQAARAARVDLGDLGPRDVDAVDVPALLEPVRDAAELLRCAALLEAPHLERWPAPTPSWSKLESALDRAAPVAPELAVCEVGCVRSLRLRGRVFCDRIWVGVPAPADPVGPALEHVVWQAGHEATVREIARVWRGSERSVEQAALVLMAERAERASRAESHARWLAEMAGLPSLDRASLAPDLRALVAQLLTVSPCDPEHR